MIDPVEFDRLVKDALANLYDTVALEIHPINLVIIKPLENPGTRSEYLHQVFATTIESLQPRGKEFSISSPEVRPYSILHDRYIAGISISELQTRLSLSERQLRREHARALRALVSRLWDKIYPGVSFIQQPETEVADLELAPEELLDYQVQSERLDLREIIRDAMTTFGPRLQLENIAIKAEIPEDLPPVQADLVILRLIILSVFNLSIQLQSAQKILVQLSATPESEKINLSFRFAVNSISLEQNADVQEAVSTSAYWLTQLEGNISAEGFSGTSPGDVIIKIDLPRASQPAILVVDDHEPAIRLYQSYLWQSSLRVVGLRDATQVILTASQLKPAAILLDVMMPGMDGWKVLQTLKSNPETSQIPVLICSVWNEPELARSLGATGFLKKPIKQRDLLEALTRLGLQDNLA